MRDVTLQTGFILVTGLRIQQSSSKGMKDGDTKDSRILSRVSFEYYPAPETRENTYFFKVDVGFS
jgi:hypothetical protein